MRPGTLVGLVSRCVGNPLDAEEMTSRLDVTQCALGP